MKFLATAFLFLVSLSANALELVDVAGTYAVDDAETQKYLEQKIDTLSKEGRPTEELENMLREAKTHPAGGRVTFTIASDVFQMKIEEEETKSAYSELKNGTDQINFTVRMEGKAMKMEIRKPKEGTILMTTSDGSREVTIVLIKKP